MSVSTVKLTSMNLQNLLLAIIFATGLMAGILLESRVFSPLGNAGNVASAQPEGLNGMPAGAAGAAGTAGASGAVAPPQQQPVAPQLLIEEQTFDFGTLSDAETIEHTFEIRSIGHLPLEFSQIGVDCGWLSADLGDRIVEPGASTTLAIRGRLKGRNGPQKQIVTLKNNSRNSETILTVVGTVIPAQ